MRYEVLDVHKPIVNVGKLTKAKHKVAMNPPGERSFIGKGGREIGLLRKGDVFWFRGRQLEASALTRHEKKMPSYLEKTLDTR